jgi:hypothetical protein
MKRAIEIISPRFKVTFRPEEINCLILDQSFMDSEIFQEGGGFPPGPFAGADLPSLTDNFEPPQ